VQLAPAAIATTGPAPEADPPPSVACFYSISSPFAGLRSVPLGRLLIKTVLSTLQRDQPQLTTFVTLSPIPGFRAWLESRLARHAADASATTILSASASSPATHGPAETPYVLAEEAQSLERLLDALREAGLSPRDPFETLGPLHEPLHEPAGHEVGDPNIRRVRHALLSLCARYLCLAKKRQRALDSVAAFHLRNGATLRSIRWGANPSARGRRESAAMMVNYEYTVGRIEDNHSAYVERGEISAVPGVWSLAEGRVDEELEDRGADVGAVP